MARVAAWRSPQGGGRRKRTNRLCWSFVFSWQEQRGIHKRSVETDAEVQVRTSDTAGSAHLADDIARRHFVAGLHADLTQVAEHRHHALAVVDEYRISVKEVIARIHHDPIGRRLDRRACTGGDVHPAVRIARLLVEET